jgi:DNA-nicking Smr family endonuclease
MQLDLHSFTLKEAKEIIKKEIINCYNNNINTLEIIHGYNNGTSIKNYLKNSKELRSLKEVKEIVPSLLNSGKSIIYLNIKIKS